MGNALQVEVARNLFSWGTEIVKDRRPSLGGIDEGARYFLSLTGMLSAEHSNGHG